jgi:hypothetical protein
MNNRSSSDGFRCLHCRTFVTADRSWSGVCHRNHCPFCLWSRHVDWLSPGDRLSSCKGAMQPVGLTLKRIRKKYGGRLDGELMVIHQCVECRRVSVNRIAADDGAEMLADVFFSSIRETREMRVELDGHGIRLLQRSDWEIVSRGLFGAIPLSGMDDPFGRVHPTE